VTRKEKLLVDAQDTLNSVAGVKGDLSAEQFIMHGVSTAILDHERIESLEKLVGQTSAVATPQVLSAPQPTPSTPFNAAHIIDVLQKNLGDYIESRTARNGNDGEYAAEAEHGKFNAVLYSLKQLLQLMLSAADEWERGRLRETVREMRGRVG